MLNIDISKLNSYDKIIVYGAGWIGSNLLSKFFVYKVEYSKVDVWDLRYSQLEEICGYKVKKPGFNLPIVNENNLVIIALCPNDNLDLVNEIQQIFKSVGYKNIVTASELVKAKETHAISEFKNEAYQDCSYQDDVDFSNYSSCVKPLAFYLPQFHEIPENNEWWGEGFTEWTNTRKARPKFEGHYQPREPHDDFGYYDLSDVEVIRKQAELAKRHGIYGWSIYYYWFSGRRLLNKPLDILLENPDIDINYCLTWCNESWSKIWVGDHKEELINCAYLEEDPEKFIGDLKKYVDDKRYICVDRKPLIIVYKPQNIPNLKNVIKRWRDHAFKIGIGEIAVYSTNKSQILNDSDIHDCFDGAQNFSPVHYAITGVQLEDKENTVISDYSFSYDECFENYKTFVEAGSNNYHLSCMAGWDNTPRYDKNFMIYDLGFKLRTFYDMVMYVKEDAIKHKKEFIFVFAWNEWAEGAYLEPDKKFGYATINTFSKALFGIPFEDK